MPFDLFLSAFVSLFVVIDPFGTAAVFIVLTQGMDRSEQKKTALKGAAIAVAILGAFSLIGEPLLRYMGIELSAFKIAGGLLLFVAAFRMIIGFNDPDQLNSGQSMFSDRSNIAVFPLAIPLLAGPGVLTAMVMFSAEAKGTVEYGLVMLAMMIVMAIAVLCLCFAGYLGRLLGPAGNGIVTRVMGILLAAMSVQFIADGIRQIFMI